MYETLIIDLDGTTFCEDGIKPINFNELLEAASRNQTIPVICTARPLSEIRLITSGITVSFFVVSNDGAIIAYYVDASAPPIILRDICIKTSSVNNLKKAVAFNNKQPDFYFLSYAASSMVFYCSDMDNEKLKILSTLTPGRRYVQLPDNNIILEEILATKCRAISWFCRERDVLKATEIDSLQRLVGSDSIVYSYAETRISQDFHWVEIVSNENSKHSAIDWLLTNNYINRSILGLGNGMNDIGFLKICDMSLCPSTAIPEVKKIVTKTTTFSAGKDFNNYILSLL